MKDVHDKMYILFGYREDDPASEAKYSPSQTGKYAFDLALEEKVKGIHFYSPFSS